MCLFGSVKGGEKPEWKFYTQLENILFGKDSSTDQDDSFNLAEKIPEDSLGQQEDEDTHDWEILGHSGLEGIPILQSLFKDIKKDILNC